MLFNSLEFFIFFPIVTLLYFLLKHKDRWLHLLIASCVFYMFFVPVYILILVFTIIIDYFAGILIENAEGERRKFFLVMSLVANIGVLFVFKYYGFFYENVAEVSRLLNIEYALPALAIDLPAGLPNKIDESGGNATFFKTNIFDVMTGQNAVKRHEAEMNAKYIAENRKLLDELLSALKNANVQTVIITI